MNRALIYTNYNLNKNSGGPIGFFYKCIYENNPTNTDIILLGNSKNNFFLLKIFLFLFKIIFKLLRQNNVYYNLETFINFKAYKYPVLYFHDIYTFHNVRKFIRKNQKVILQSHSPVTPLEEYIDYNGKKNSKKIKKIQDYCFKRANYIVLPNKECVSIYKKLITPKQKIEFITTGIKNIKADQNLCILDDKVNLLYIGRKIDVKGFDNLITNFNEVLKIRKDIRLFIIGSGKKIIGENIYDLGTSEIVYDWINSVDFVISNNKQSYFDLNIIETIALGTPLIMTTTEGHEFFKNRKGIISYEFNTLSNVLKNSNLITKKFKQDNKENLINFYTEELNDVNYKKNIHKLVDKALYDK